MLRAVVTFPLYLVLGCPGEAAALPIEDFSQLAIRCAPSVAPSTLAAIAKVESRFDPLAVHDNTTGQAIRVKDQASAERSVISRMRRGHSVDVGLMQVNSKNFAVLGLTTSSVFEPCDSLRAAARLLVGHYHGGKTAQEKQLSLRQTISAYNTGDLRRGFINGYVHRVEVAAAEIVPALKQSEEKDAVPERSATRDWNVWDTEDRGARPDAPGILMNPPLLSAPRDAAPSDAKQEPQIDDGDGLQ